MSWLRGLVKSADIEDNAVTTAKLTGELQGIAGVGNPIPTKLVLGFQDDETWAEEDCTLVRDTAAANVKYGDRSLKQTVNANTISYAACTLAETVGIRNDIGFWIKVDTVANVSGLGIFIYSDDGGGAPEAGYYRAYFYTSIPINHLGLKDGEWKFCRINRGPFSPSGSPTDWSSSNPVNTVRKIRLYARANAAGAINVHWGSMTTLMPERAGLVLMFDGSWSDGPPIIEPAFTARGWAACTCSPGSQFGVGGALTVEQLLALEAKGWDVVTHSWDHGEYSDVTPTSEIRSDFAKTQKMFADMGLVNGQYFNVWAGNIGDSAADPDTGELAGDLARRFFLSSRGDSEFKDVDHWNTLRALRANSWIPQDWHALYYRPWYLTNNTDFSLYMEPWLDAMIADRTVGFPYTHKILASPGPYDVSLGFWEDMLVWLDANVYHPIKNPGGMVELMTWTQWYNRIVGRPGSVRAGHDGGIYQIDGAGTTKLIG